MRTEFCNSLFNGSHVSQLGRFRNQRKWNGLNGSSEINMGYPTKRIIYLHIEFQYVCFCGFEMCGL